MIMRLFAICLLAPVALWGLWPHGHAKPDSPELVRIPAGAYTYRPPGEFRLGNRVVDAPMEERRATDDLAILKYQVSEADYARCVVDGACSDLVGGGSADYPQTGVSYTDAVAYAQWFSDETGQQWRLPTDAEWMRAAADRAFDDAAATGAAPTGADSSDPSRRWLASYRRETALRGAADPVRHPIGFVPESEAGVADMAGNVWEWTGTCMQNGRVSADGQRIVAATDYCGVRAVQGKHRAFVITFVRDARSGGCATGVPPDYLGFRLVHEDGAAQLPVPPA